MDFFFKHKFIVVIIVIIVTAVAWYMLAGSSNSPDAVLVSESVQEIPPEAQDLLNSLQALQSVDLEGSIFTNPSFHLLKDFSTPIIPEPLGRANPFAPYETNVSSVSTTTASSPR